MNRASLHGARFNKRSIKYAQSSPYLIKQLGTVKCWIILGKDRVLFWVILCTSCAHFYLRFAVDALQ